MGKLTRRETCKRSFFGWVFLILFLLFNALMLLWLVGYWSMLSGYVEPTEPGRVGKTMGGTLASGALLIIWGIGDVILGLPAILTRGSKTIVEQITP